MKLFSTFDIHRSYELSPIKNQTTPTDITDPNEMYAKWIAPSIDIFETFPKNNWIKEIQTVTTIFLNLKKKQKKIINHRLLKEISIQISIYEALIFRDILLNQPLNHWSLSTCDQAIAPNEFLFQSKNSIIKTTIMENMIHFQKDQFPIGHLIIEMENNLLEKLQGLLFEKPFIIDPIWLRHQKKIDAIKLQIDQFKTEIVHRKTHKNTIWTGKNQTFRMCISKNESLSIHPQLLLNAKTIHWKSFTLYSFQWLTPWYRLPIHGQFKLVRDKTRRF